MSKDLDERGLYHNSRSLLESRSAPLGWALITSIVALVVTVGAWSAWAEIEELVVASGRVEPAGKVKLVNHVRGGKVAELMVANGEIVKAGMPLLRLDADTRQGDFVELRGRFQVTAMMAARLAAEAYGTPFQPDAELARERPDLVGSESRLQQAREEAHTARRETLGRAVQTKRGELRSVAAEIGRVKNSLVLLRQQHEAVKELAERGLYPKLRLVTIERQVSDAEGELAKAEATLTSAQAALAENESRLASVDKDWKSEVLTELAQTTADRDRLSEQLASQAELLGSMLVTAPVDGIIQDLAVTGVGQSVGANETLMRLVPIGEGLVVEARVANSDIGRLRPGLEAKVKVRTYDFLRHGTLKGHVAKIAADATPEPKTGEPSYLVTVVTDGTRLGVKAGELELGPGMLVDVELQVGQRTLLSYLTDRIWRLRDEAFRQG